MLFIRLHDSQGFRDETQATRKLSLCLGITKATPRLHSQVVSLFSA